MKPAIEMGSGHSVTCAGVTPNPLSFSVAGQIMNPSEVKSIRSALGLTQTELGLWLMLSGEQPGHTVRMWESGKRTVTGPVEVCLTAFASGYVPPHIAKAQHNPSPAPKGF